jgi:hypothetical protein
MIAVLRDDAFEPELAGVLEDDLAVVLDMLVKLDARGQQGGRPLLSLREQRFKSRLAGVQRLRPEILSPRRSAGTR